jgi:hypothetical protein
LITKHIFIILLLLGVNSSVFCQEEGRPTPHGIKLDFKLPTATSNRSFKGVMSGLADIDLGYQFKLKENGMFFNTGLKYSYWNLESTVFSVTNITGKLEILQPFIGLGWRHDFSEKVFLESEMKFGYAYLLTKSSTNPIIYRQESVALEPKVGLYLKTSALMSVGLTLNYNIINDKFTPENIGVTNFPGFGPETSEGNYQYFSIGFGIYGILPTFK